MCDDATFLCYLEHLPRDVEAVVVDAVAESLSEQSCPDGELEDGGGLEVVAVELVLDEAVVVVVEGGFCPVFVDPGERCVDGFLHVGLLGGEG